MTPKEHIEDIAGRYLKADPEYVLHSLNRSIDRIEKAFPKYGSFIMEFIQNADDAHATIMRMEIVENAIRVFNNGNPFSKDDVDSICRIGLSSKTSKDYIGYLGVGFKSVFLVSESPEIYSGDYSFGFKKDHFEDPSKLPWQVIPLWIDEPTISIPQGFRTAFNIPLKDSSLVVKLQDETKPDSLSNRILLFLRHLNTIEIYDYVSGTQRTIKKSLQSETSDYRIYTIQEFIDGELRNKENWLIFRSVCNVPEEVRRDSVTRDWERDKVDKREVIVAFRLDDAGNLLIEEKGTAHAGVFSFLPLKEVPSGLNFLIQADFLTGPGRAELARESAWNVWLAEEIYKLIVGKCIPTFLKNDKWKWNFTEILYPPTGGHELFEKYIKQPLREYLENNPVLIGEDGTEIEPSKAIYVDPSVRELVSLEDLEKLYPDKKAIHLSCKIPQSIQRKTKQGPAYSSESLDSEMMRLMQLKAGKKDIEFFKKLYHKLSEYLESKGSCYFIYQKILVTDAWELVNRTEAYIKPSSVTIPEGVAKHLKIIHPDLSDDSTVLQFLKKLEVKELSEEHIREIVQKMEIPSIAETWPSLSDHGKIEKIRMFKDLWKKGKINIADLNFLTLKTKKGKWIKPSEIIFSKEYKPGHQIEILTEKGLLDLPIEFTSSEFIENYNDEEVKSWRDFFKALHVEEGQELKKIVQRIGVLLAIQYEKSKGREVKDVEAYDLGYDLESKGGDEVRYIEVKSSSESNPDIWLTANEIRAMRKIQNEQKMYYVYVVKDAIKSPTLYVVRGDRLLSILESYETQVIIYFKDWSNKEGIEDEFRL